MVSFDASLYNWWQRCALLENVEGCKKRIGQDPDPDGYEASCGGVTQREEHLQHLYTVNHNQMASLAIWPTWLKLRNPL